MDACGEAAPFSAALASGLEPKRGEPGGKVLVASPKEFSLLEEQRGAESPYDRRLGDAMAGDRTLFTSEAAVEAAWRVVDPILKRHHGAITYTPGGWGPKQADGLLGPDGQWRNPGRTNLSGSAS